MKKSFELGLGRREQKKMVPKKLAVDRRTFLKATALGGAAVGAGKILGPLESQSAQPVGSKGPGVLEEKWVATSCLNCQARCAIRVRVVNGKAVKITGNPASKISDGKICPRGHIGLQVLYDPERIKTPLKRTNPQKGVGVDPKWVSISWDQALGEVTDRLSKLREKGDPNKLLLFYGLNTISSQDMMIRFSEAYGTPNLISGDGLDSETEKSGNWLADGHYAQTAYDLDQTNYILAFGADLLESAKPLSRYLRKWGKIRREKPNRTKIVVINPRYSVTAAKADEWIPIQPGTDGALAMGLAHVIIHEELYDKAFVRDWTVGFEAYKNLALSQYRPEEVSKTTGIPVETIRRIGRELARTRPSLALRGPASINWPEGSFTSYAIYCLNALVGSIDVPGGVLYQESVKYNDLPRLVEDDLSKKGRAKPALDLRGTDKYPGARVVTHQVPESLIKDIPYPIEMAMGINSNFNLLSPAGTGRWDQALKKLPYYVHVSPFLSEMALYADLILPSTTFLEEWGYDHSPPGSGFSEVKIKQPVVMPQGIVRSVTDILFQVAKRLGGAMAQSFSNMGDTSEGFVRFRTETLIPWSDFLNKGVGVGRGYEYHKYARIFQTPSRKFEFSSGNLKALKTNLDALPHYKEPRFLGEKDKYPLLLLPYQPLMVVENGSQNYPWAQEIFLPMAGVGWETLVELNSETAKSLKLREGQWVWVESPFQKIKAKVKILEGVHPEVVAIPSGQGHTSYGKWQRGIGVNPNDILGVDYDTLSGQAVFFNTRVKVYKA
jgi:anaerobic selenocysteine-containing dehydrogenase